MGDPALIAVKRGTHIYSNVDFLVAEFGHEITVYRNVMSVHKG